jgi:hypothetical protein
MKWTLKIITVAAVGLLSFGRHEAEAMAQESTQPTASADRPTEPNYLSNDLAAQCLDHFILEHGPYRVDIVPKRCDPDFVDRYLREKVKMDAEPPVFIASRRVVDWYDLRRTLPHFEAALGGEGDGAGFYRSLEVVAMLAQVGDAEAWKHANDHFQNKLLTNRLADEYMGPLVRVWATLGPAAPVGALEKRLTELVSFREKAAGTSDDGFISHQRARAVLDNDLPRAKMAVEHRAKVEKLTGDAQLAALIDNYARLDDYPPEYLNTWSARMLRKAAEHPEQRVRIVKLMSERIDTAAKDREVDSDLRGYVKRRLLRAIEYFDAARLTEEEKSFLQAQLKEAGEGDPLCTLQPPPLAP